MVQFARPCFNLFFAGERFDGCRTWGFGSKHKGEKQQQGGDNHTCKSDFRPFQVSCVSRVLLLEFIIIIIYVAVVPGAQTELNEDIPRDGYQKQRARHDVEHNIHNVFAGMIADIAVMRKRKSGPDTLPVWCDSLTTRFDSVRLNT